MKQRDGDHREGPAGCCETACEETERSEGFSLYITIGRLLQYLDAILHQYLVLGKALYLEDSRGFEATSVHE